VQVYGRPTYSGTHEFFRNRVLGSEHDPERRQFAPTAKTFEKSEDLVRAVSADPTAIGYVGLGYMKPGVKALPLSDAEHEGAVLPDASSVRNGSYAVYRPLLMYTRGPPAGKVAAFLRFVLSQRGQSIVEKHGFIGSDAEASAVVDADVSSESAKAHTDVHRILFRQRSAELDAQALSALTGLAAELSAGEQRALIIGNADLRGSARANTELARRRAELVAEHLAGHGVARELLRVEAVSAARPLATNGTQSGRDLNRRVDVYLVRR
jgi:phosphate transport system substrate-binding protein